MHVPPPVWYNSSNRSFRGRIIFSESVRSRGRMKVIVNILQLTIIQIERTKNQRSVLDLPS